MPYMIFIIPLLFAFIFIILSRWKNFIKKNFIKKKPSLPSSGYKLIYSDQKPKKRVEGIVYSKRLLSEKYELSGKPDFIFRKNGKLLPVELKSGVIGDAALPREGDLMQLVAYFLIIEDLYGTRPKYGRLIYKDYMFIVRNTGVLRKRLADTLTRMRAALETGYGLDPEEEAGYIKCRYCMCRGSVCEICEN